MPTRNSIESANYLKKRQRRNTSKAPSLSLKKKKREPAFSLQSIYLLLLNASFGCFAVLVVCCNKTCCCPTLIRAHQPHYNNTSKVLNLIEQRRTQLNNSSTQRPGTRLFESGTNKILLKAAHRFQCVFHAPSSYTPRSVGFREVIFYFYDTAVSNQAK